MLHDATPLKREDFAIFPVPISATINWRVVTNGNRIALQELGIVSDDVVILGATPDGRFALIKAQPASPGVLPKVKTLALVFNEEVFQETLSAAIGTPVKKKGKT